MNSQDEKSYHDACAALFDAVEKLLEARGADYDNNGHVIEIETAAGEVVIINKQAPMREVWLAARSGGRHFALKDGVWRDTRDGGEFLARLGELVGEDA